ncbi:unnamed protein product [Rotaria sp. Silwood1]|nr:unnamed protein product [Rotaria sp. Silwood1]CAF3880998.1 unnamed protein product [Rotaria sp. Silwood1]CAF4926671.1 unnamed protein product [Rotaria sp. Silwood1]
MASKATDVDCSAISTTSTATNSSRFNTVVSPNISINGDLEEKISQILELEGIEEKDQIISDVLTNGRQVLVRYKEVLIPEVYSTEIKNADDPANTSTSEYAEQTDLLKLLIQDVYVRWEAVCKDQPVIWEFICNIKQENKDHFDAVLGHIAEYGTTYTKSSSVLAIILQLLFQGIDDDCLKTQSVFTALFDSVTREGLQGCRHFAKYISEDDLNEQLNQSESPLFLALRMYYCGKIPEIFKQHKIPDTKHGLYSLAIDNVTRNGWLKGIESVKSKIPPIKYQPLLQTVEAMITFASKHEPSTSNQVTKTMTSSTVTTGETTSPNKNLGELRQMSFLRQHHAKPTETS